MNNIEIHKNITELRRLSFDGRFKNELFDLRKLYSENHDFQNIIDSKDLEKIRHFLESVNLCVSVESLEIFINECQIVKENQGEKWIIEPNSGLLLTKMNKESLFQVKSVDEKGDDSLSFAIHPSVSSSLALTFQELFEHNKFLKNKNLHTTYHEKDINIIKTKVCEALEERQIIVNAEENGEKIIIEFGREYFMNRNQSINENFHKYQNFSAVIAAKIMNHKPKAVGKMGIELKRNKTQKWYELSVIILKD